MTNIVEVSDDTTSAYYIDGQKFTVSESGDYKTLLAALGYRLEYRENEQPFNGWPERLPALK